MERYLIAMAAAAALAGCAITSSSNHGPSGQPVHFIDGMSAGVAYDKAHELCPMGYAILGEPRQVSVVDYIMTIECRPGAQVSPSMASSEAPTRYQPLMR